jgi:sulfite exporter TauE/SafE
MVEALLIVAGGLCGSGHCIGMCGGFVLTLGGTARSWRTNLFRQLLYATGRISTYTLAGAVVGFTSWQLGRELPEVVHVQAILSILAGVMLVAEGLFALGMVPRPFAHTHAGCPGAGALGMLLRGKEASAVFVAGLMNGVLPCGLVYGYLALAASSGQMLLGAGTMTLFGLGTLPSMLLTGMAGSLLRLSWRRRLFQLAACCMLLTGVLALVRGAMFLHAGEAPDAEGCPYCTD